MTGKVLTLMQALQKSNQSCGARNDSQRSIAWAGSYVLFLVKSIHEYRPGNYRVELHRLRDGPETLRRHDPEALRLSIPRWGGGAGLPNREIVAAQRRPRTRYGR